MKALKLLTLSLLFTNLLQAQSKNIFWERAFWKTNPTIEIVEQKIAEGNSATSLNSNGFDAVTYAILEQISNKTIIHLLSKDGNNVNKLTHDKRTYVFWAAYKNNTELMEYLISKNARMDLKDSHQYSVLTFAAATGVTNLEVYNLCIKNGIDIENDVDGHGANSLLLLIPHLKDFEIVEYFTKRGLSIDSKDNDGNGVFNYTAKAGNRTMLDALIEKDIPNELNNNGGNSILLATRGSRKGYNPLDFFKYLEGLGIKPNIKNNDGLTPLHNLAYGNKDLETFDYFLSKGVDANQVDNEGNTALINASRRNTLEVITKLADNTQKVSHVNNNGQSALTKAINNTPQVISFLVEKGADVHVIDTKGNNLAYYLVESFDAKKLDAFKQKMKLLTDSGLDIKTIQKDGSTLFHLAIDANNLDLLKQINALGIDVNTKNNDGLTALHLAAMKAKNTKIITYLLSIGADKSIKTDFEESVYDLAKENELLIDDINFLK